ncbi:MAG TPA: hypothetical protein VFQ91_12030 [Bryobacteraceae bacterium]|nr:hypothetical protein [Bryobacteraceae bacterium]
MISPRRQSQRGYALIFVFAMAAMMAMSLYLEMPRLALEMQRNREELLIERGEQYVRAIKVFQKKNKKYPQTIEELESTNSVRFLRRRYLDPMTGKDDWRIIHADASGRLTDSLVQKQNTPGQTDPTKSTNNFVSEGPSVGATGSTGEGRLAQALVRRASEQPGAAGAPPLPGAPDSQSGNGNPVSDPLQQQQQMQQLQQSVPVMGPNGQPIQRVPGLPGQFGTGSPYPSQVANSQNGGTANSNQQQNSTTGGGYTFGSGYSGSSTPTTPSTGPMQAPPTPGSYRPGAASGGMVGGPVVPGAPIPGGPQQGGIAVNPATQMIQQILTRPNPQGLSNAMGGGTQALGGGIVGVASKYDAEGIKIYKDRTNYKEWEFVYDASKDQKLGGQIPGQTPGQQPGQNNTPNNNSPFNNNRR